MKKRNILLLLFWGLIISGVFIIYNFYRTHPKSSIFTLRKKIKKEKIKETGVTKKEPRQPPPSLARAFKIKKVYFKDVLPVMGTVKAKAEVPLRFETNGVIKKIYFKEGELIKKGDCIACLDPKDAQLKLEYAQGKLEAAKASYESLLKKLEINRHLYEVGAIIEAKLKETELEVESAKAQVASAQAEKAIAEEELRKTCIYAIKDGVMGPKKAEEGEFVTPQIEIGSFLDIAESFVEVGIVERDLKKVKAGMKAEIFVDAYPNKVFKGKVERIYPVVEGKSRTLTAKIKVLNPQALLLPGMFARAEIFSIEIQDALIVPSVSLVKSGGGSFLLPVVRKDTITKEEEGTILGTVRLITPKVGYITSDYAQILEGVEEDDLVITEVQGNLQNNSRVRIIGIEEFSS